jgi:hypothetical protein
MRWRLPAIRDPANPKAAPSPAGQEPPWFRASPYRVSQSHCFLGARPPEHLTENLARISIKLQLSPIASALVTVGIRLPMAGAVASPVIPPLLNHPAEPNAGAAISVMAIPLHLTERRTAVYDGAVPAVASLGMSGDAGSEKKGNYSQQVARMHVTVPAY